MWKDRERKIEDKKKELLQEEEKLHKIALTHTNKPKDRGINHSKDMIDLNGGEDKSIDS